MPKRTQPDGPDPDHEPPIHPKSVLDSVEEVTGEKPKIFLRDADSEPGGSPFVDPKGKDSKLFPQGRGNYQILGEIARGGMGVILKGHDTDLGRDVAVKVLDERLLGNPVVLQRFVEEAQIGGQLQHPGVVPVYEMGLMADERPYFTMKLVKGRTLTALLNKRKSLEDDRRRFLSIFEAICQTVAYAHSKGVIHRDLKPANVMVGAFGEVQVVDWGLAKVLMGGGTADELRARQTQMTVIETVRSGPGSDGSDSIVGSVMGTPAYMAPEQAMGEIEKIDERADVFALGAILCEILTGKPPYVSAEKERTVALAAHAKLEPARDRLRDCRADAELKELVSECLSPAPAARPQSAEELAQRVQDYLSGLEEKAHRAELAATEAREQRRRLRLTVALAGTVLVAVVVIGLSARTFERQREAARVHQLETTRQALDSTAAQVLGLQEDGRHQEALEVARTALLVVGSGDAEDEAMTERANHIVALAEERVAEQERRRDVGRQNRELLASCEELRMKQIEASFGFSPLDLNRTLDADYETAFREYGIDFADEDLNAALERLRSSGIGTEVALALDDWASVRRINHGFEAYEVQSVIALAFDMDPDPVRTRLREALLASDRETMLSLAQGAELATMPASTAWVLSQALVSMGLEEEAFAVVRTGVRAHPGDFLLNFKMGHIHADAGHDIPAIHYLSAARGLRPDNAAVHALLGDAYNDTGDSPRAKQAYLEAVRLNPELKRIYRFAGWYAFLSGDLEAAVEAYDQLRVYFSTDGQWEFEGNLARSFAGRYPMETLAREVSPGELSHEAGFTAWGLVYHPDREQRNPELALALITPIIENEYWDYGGYMIAAAANLELGRPEEALDLLERGYALEPVSNRIFLAAGELLRGKAYAQLGERERARRSLAQAESSMEEFLYDGWDPWEGAVIERLFRELSAMVE